MNQRELEIRARLDELNCYDLFGYNGGGLNRGAQRELFALAEELLEIVKSLHENEFDDIESRRL